MYSEEGLKQLLYENGASLVGFADLSGLLDNDMKKGVAIAIRLPKDVITGIHNGPTREYYNAYNEYNQRLDKLALLAECYLMNWGYKAYAQTTDRVKEDSTYRTKVPHKTVATNAGLGWIGKSALFVSKEYGPAVRLTSVLTNAPLSVGEAITKSLCGSCTRCHDACPGRAISGKLWSVDVDRDELFDPFACRKKARELAQEDIHEEITLCGKCIEVCPYSLKKF